MLAVQAGGGMYLSGQHDMTIEDVIFSGCVANEGAAVFCVGGGLTISFNRVLFQNNSAVTGGAVSNVSNNTATSDPSSPLTPDLHFSLHARWP